jgi:hypothetical protein
MQTVDGVRAEVYQVLIRGVKGKEGFRPPAAGRMRAIARLSQSAWDHSFVLQGDFSSWMIRCGGMGLLARLFGSEQKWNMVVVEHCSPKHS